MSVSRHLFEAVCRLQLAQYVGHWDPSSSQQLDPLTSREEGRAPHGWHGRTDCCENGGASSHRANESLAFAVRSTRKVCEEGRMEQRDD